MARTPRLTSSPHSRSDNVETGAIDDEYRAQEKDFRAACLHAVMPADLEAAHIIPFSYGSWKDSQREMFEILYRFFPGVRKGGMRITHINDLSNGITLQDSIHTQFRRFQLAFVATGVANEYKIKVYDDFPTAYRTFVQDSVTFRNAEGDDNESLPNPKFLECHYRLVEILHLSGMGEYIEKNLRDWEELRDASVGEQVQEDGSTDLVQYVRATFWQSVNA
ncbi:hypothetical protein MW887_003605 [Aspergillus wentii]|nr:hypothetical protein MW887_003605 [Aspergillus wentii]